MSFLLGRFPSFDCAVWNSVMASSRRICIFNRFIWVLNAPFDEVYSEEMRKKGGLLHPLFELQFVPSPSLSPSHSVEFDFTPFYFIKSMRLISFYSSNCPYGGQGGGIGTDPPPLLARPGPIATTSDRIQSARSHTFLFL